jgi:hypothetical protein
MSGRLRAKNRLSGGPREQRRAGWRGAAPRRLEESAASRRQGRLDCDQCTSSKSPAVVDTSASFDRGVNTEKAKSVASATSSSAIGYAKSIAASHRPHHEDMRSCVRRSREPDTAGEGACRANLEGPRGGSITVPRGADRRLPRSTTCCCPRHQAIRREPTRGEDQLAAGDDVFEAGAPVT